MDSSGRAKLHSAVEEGDVKGLVDLVKQLAKDGTLTDTMAEFSSRQLDEFLEGTFRICMAHLLNDEENNVTILDQMCDVLSCVASLVLATVQSLALGADNRSGENVVIPPLLQDIAIILHGVMPTLPAARNQLKDELSHLFEYWWIKKLPVRQELMGNSFTYLLNKSVQEKSTQADVARVAAVQTVLAAVDLSQESASTVISLLLQCTFHPQFVTTVKGLKFLAYLFTLNVEFTQQLHQTIKNHLPHTPKSWHSRYGELYLRAWKQTEGEKKEKLEKYCIQDLMYKAVHSQRHPVDMFKILFRLLSFIHKEKTQKDVENMLHRLYEPILWRSMSVPNSAVRVNSATLMFDVFPLLDSALNCEEIDKLLQKQFDLMHDLLTDTCADVRHTAVNGVGSVMNLYWELIPSQVIQSFVKCLIEDLAYDNTSALVREAVIKVMYLLCNNHLCIPLLQRVLPELQNFIHDSSERVRIAMLDLLLKIKGLRAIKFWNVVPIKHILARLSCDTDPVVRRIVKLIQNSFVPLDQPSGVQIERCRTLITMNALAARKFFIQLPPLLGLNETVRYMIMICRYILEHGNDSNSSGSDKVLPRPGSKQRRTRQQTRVSVTKDDEDDNDEGSVNSGAGSSQLDADVLRGLVEAIYLMYMVVGDDLRSQENRQLKEGLDKKLVITVRELIPRFKGKGVDEALIGLASNLPVRALASVSQMLLTRLKQGFSSAEHLEGHMVIKSLVLWGQANAIIELLQETLEKSLVTDEEKKGSKQSKRKVSFSVPRSTLDPPVALDCVDKMITQAECRPVLLENHREGLMSLTETLKHVMPRLQNILSNKSPTQSQNASEWLVEIYTMYMRLSTFLCVRPANGSRNELNLKSVHSGITWANTCIMPQLQMDIPGQSRDLAVVIMEKTIRTCCNLLMIGSYDASLLDQIIEMCIHVLQEPWAYGNLSSHALACVYQLTQIRKLHKDGTGTEDTIPASQHSLACHCLSQFLRSICEKTHVNGKKTDDKDKISQLLNAVGQTVSEIIFELTRPWTPVDVAEKSLASVLGAMVRETRFCSEDKGGELEKLPTITTFLLSTVGRTAALKRTFIAQLHAYLDSDEVQSIHHLTAIMSILTSLRKEPNVIPLSLYQSVYQALQKVPVTLDLDVFRDLKKQIEDQLKKWNMTGAMGSAESEH